MRTRLATEQYEMAVRQRESSFRFRPIRTIAPLVTPTRGEDSSDAVDLLKKHGVREKPIHAVQIILEAVCNEIADGRIRE